MFNPVNPSILSFNPSTPSISSLPAQESQLFSKRKKETQKEETFHPFVSSSSNGHYHTNLHHYPSNVFTQFFLINQNFFSSKLYIFWGYTFLLHTARLWNFDTISGRQPLWFWLNAQEMKRKWPGNIQRIQQEEFHRRWTFEKTPPGIYIRCHSISFSPSHSPKHNLHTCYIIDRWLLQGS